jgi:phosphoglycolate phosphatase
VLHIIRSIPKDALKLLVFDLDGTLIDSRADLCASVNATLKHYGRAPLPDQVIAGFIGDGVSMLVRRSLGNPEDQGFVDQATEFFLDYYREHKLDHTYVYDGVLEALALLRAKYGHRQALAVLSNKPVAPCRDICAALQLSPFFFQIHGGNSFPLKKPDPQGLQALMSEAGASPAQTLMVGDSDIDVLTARNAGAWSIGCKFGLSPHTLEQVQPDCLVDSPQDWLAALL